MISGISIKNIRALRNSGEISVKKINVLVGKNSSGKSTLIRLFPLLRQSVEVRTKGPILWYGRLIDFGSLREVKSEGAGNEPVSLSFNMEIAPRSARSSKIVLKQSGAKYQLPRTVRLTLDIDEGPNDSGFVSRVELKIGEDVAIIHYSLHRVKLIEINGYKFEPTSEQIWFSGSDRKIPMITFLSKKAGEDGTPFYMDDRAWVTNKIASHLRVIAHGNTSTEKLRLVASQLSYLQVEEFKSQIRGLTTAPESLIIEMLVRDVRSTFHSALRSNLLLRALPEILQEIDENFNALGKGVRYIEPLRASVERYYRLQDLAVDEIDSSGANTAMYLHSLSEHDKRRLRSWMKKSLGFYAYTDAAGGNVEIKIVVGQEKKGRNVTDLGFGYSQILPVVLQLWHSYEKGPGRQQVDASVVAIEQPELHLHPSYQALLADVFSSASESDRVGRIVPMFIETHSEHLINRLGALVAEKSLSRDDVQVILFEKIKGSTSVKSVMFDADGVLEDSWPLGFFLPEV
ncbi:AAA family ATPase [Stenotrophomonas maltophilia]|uniref:AAA family ATPase n=1 Tax=Stenotrophomonas maltophilia TaxID=40324 RepID=UPI001C99388C|nr:AAA family ATPase [Stenotrophomonas maltophilia]MBY6279024.1 AAA family ATPase [Stenotrophomonas maltophilia]